VDDASQVGPLLDQLTGELASFTADGAYDQESVYADVAARHLGISTHWRRRNLIGPGKAVRARHPRRAQGRPLFLP
jgi:hypothetical protein